MKPLLAIAIAAVCAAPLAAAPTELFFSEYVEGTSNNKALEIYNGTGAAVSLGASGYNVQMFFNGNATAGLTISLTGTVAAGDVYVLAQSSADPAILAQADQTNGAGWFNGDDAVVLRKGSVIIDVIGQIGFDPGSEWGTGLTSTADNTLRRKASIEHGDPIGSDVFNPSEEWDGFATNTFDGLGNGIVPPPPDIEVHEIFEIQGSGMASPYVTRTVQTLDNIVTAVMATGFFIQTPDYRTDADPATSNGIFVFTGAAPTVHAGDQVDVTGMVVEFFNMTELGGGSVIKLDSSGNPLPSPISFNSSTPSPFQPQPETELERYEGMLVRVEHGIAASGNNQFNEISIVAKPARPFREPGITYPGLPGLPVFDNNPEIFEIDTDGTGLPAVQIPGGAPIDLVEGPLAFSFSDYQIWPTKLVYNGGAPAPRPVRSRTPGEFTIGGQNMLRMFDLVNDPDVDDETPTPQRYADRLAKLSRQVREVLGSPDVLAVEEVENVGVLQDLAAMIRFDEPTVSYTPYLLEGNDVGGIDVGFLVRDTVVVNSVRQIGKDDLFTFNGATSLLNDRPPLLLDGAYVGNGAPFRFEVIAIHQRSLSGIEAADGRVRQKRFEQSVKLAEAVQALQNAEPSVPLGLIGDFNAFEFTDGYVDVMGIIKGDLDPAGALLPGVDVVEPDLSDRVLDVPAGDRYSFVFDGTAQVLDHALTNAPWQKYYRALQYAHGNADAPVTFETDPTTALRSSDHDGIVLFTMSDFDADGYADDADSCAHGDARASVVIGDCDTGVPNTIFTGGCTIADQLNAIKAGSKNHGQYASGVAHYTQDLTKDGVITGEQKGAIESCAAQNN